MMTKPLNLLPPIDLKPLPEDFKLRDAQSIGIDMVRDAIVKEKHRKIVLQMATGSGKCLGKGTPVLMFNGTIKHVENVIVGDTLMGPDSLPRQVLSVCSGREMLYKVTPTKGDPYIVNESHILSLRTTGARVKHNEAYYEKDDIVNISIKDYFAETANFRHCMKGWRTGVLWDCDNKDELLLPPYVLGLWLGNGNSRLPMLTSSDIEVIDTWQNYATEIKHSVSVKEEKGNCTSYAIVNKNQRNNFFLTSLRKMSLILNKHIPHCYKTSSVQNRLNLLAGIIDTNGYLTHYNYDITVKQKQFAEDICFVARSLGLAAYVSMCKKGIKSTGFIGTYYRISISGETSIIPCKVKRRKASKRQQIKNVLNTGIKVKPIGKGNYYGFEISGDRLFLLGDFTVTHNTILAGKIFHQMFEKNPCQQMIFIVPRITLLRQTKEVFETVFGYDTGIIQGNSKTELHKHVQVATIQTLAKRIESDKLSNVLAYQDLSPSLIIIDEAHLMFSGIEKVYDFFQPLMIGLTATPFSKGMGLFWKKLVRPVSMESLIKNGVLSNYKVMACTPIDRTKLKKQSTGEYRDKEVDAEVERITGDVYKKWKENPEMRGRKVLLFAKSIKSCIAIADHFRKHGEAIGYVHSKMSNEAIQQELQAFRDGYYSILASVVMLIEGYDYPGVSGMIICAPLAPSKDPNIPNSPNRMLQMLGRGLRSFLGKEYCLVHDHTDNFLNYGPVEYIEHLFPDLDMGKKEDRKLTPQERIERAVRECRICGAVVKTNKCPQCQVETKKPTQFLEAGDIIFEDGEMVELKSTGSLATVEYRTSNLTPEQRKSFCDELKGYILHRRIIRRPINNEKGFYAHKYKNRTGSWPGNGYRFEDVKGKLPSSGFNSWISGLQRQYFNSLKGKNPIQ